MSATPQSPPLCVVFPYSPPKFSYLLDARKWDNKMLIEEIKKMGEYGIAYRFYLNRIEPKQILDMKKDFYLKYENSMKLDIISFEKITNLSQSIIKNTAASVLQQAIRSYFNKKEEKRYLYCGNVVKEFITTENTYCEQLEVIENIIKKPLLLQQKQLLTPDQFKLIFNGISVIYGINKALLENLREKVSVYTQASRFGKIITTFTPLLRAYSDYCQIYPRICQLVASMKPPHPFGMFYKIQMKQAPLHLQGFDFLSLLITPIQRLPRYRLLLRDLLKHSIPSDIDYNDIVKATEEIERINSFVNTQSKKQEDMEKVVGLYSQLKGLPPNIQLLQPGRELVDSTTVILKQKFVRLEENGKEINTFSSSNFNKLQKTEDSVLTKRATINIEFIEKETPVEIILFTDIILFAERSKILFFGEVLQFRLSVDIGEATFSRNDAELLINLSDETIKLNFGEKVEQWFTLLNDSFVHCHNMLENLQQRRNSIRL